MDAVAGSETGSKQVSNLVGKDNTDEVKLLKLENEFNRTSVLVYTSGIKLYKQYHALLKEIIHLQQENIENSSSFKPITSQGQTSSFTSKETIEALQQPDSSVTTDKDSHDDISCDNDRQDDSIHSNKYHDTEEESELCALPLLKPFTLSVTRLPTQRYFDTNVIVSITDSPGSSTCTCMSEEITLQNTVLSTIGTKVSQMKQFNLPIKKESDSFIGRKKKRAACVIISDDEKEGDDTYSQVTDSQKYIRNNEKVSPLYKVSNEKEEAKNKGRKGKAGRKRTKKSALPIGHKLTSKVFKPTIEKEDYQHLSLSSSEVSMQGDLRYTCKRNCLHDTEDVKEEEEEEEVEEEEKRELEIKTRNLKQNRLGRIRNNLAETVGDKHTSKSSKSANQMNEDDEHHQLCTSNCEGSFIKVKKKRVCVIISDEETEEDCEEENKKKSEQTEEKDEENMSRDDKEKNEMDKETAYGEGEKRPNKRLTRNKRKSPVQWRKASKSHQTTSNIISDEETEEDGEEENKKKSKQREGNDKEDIHVYEDNKEDKETNDGEVEEQPVLVNKKRVTRNKRKPPVQRKKASKLHQTTSNIISDKQLPQESQLVDKTLEKEGKAQEDEKEEGGSKEESFIAETPTQSTVKQQILSRLSSACYNALKRTEHTSYKRDLTTELSIASRGNPSSKPIEENSEEPIVEIKENNSSKEFGREIHNNPTQQLDENKGEELDENKGEELDENEREELDENNREELDKNKGEDHTILPSMIRKPSFNKRPSSRRSNFANQSSISILNITASRLGLSNVGIKRRTLLNSRLSTASLLHDTFDDHQTKLPGPSIRLNNTNFMAPKLKISRQEKTLK